MEMDFPRDESLSANPTTSLTSLFSRGNHKKPPMLKQKNPQIPSHEHGLKTLDEPSTNLGRRFAGVKPIHPVSSPPSVTDNNKITLDSREEEKGRKEEEENQESEEEENEEEEEEAVHGSHIWRYQKRSSYRYPPPIPLLAQTGNLPCHMPWVLKRSYEEDGRLVIHEVKVKHHEFFRARRANGRLTLRVVHFEESPKIPDDLED